MTHCMHIDPGHPDLPRLGFGVAARLYQERFGWAVLALARKQKRPHPIMKHGVLWASRDGGMVEQVWGQDPFAGVGIATGAASGLMVVDLDRHGRQDGIAVWAQFLAENRLAVPPGPWVQTPSGGQHHYYRLPPGAGMPQRPKLLPSVDLKINGGYVGAPPTVVNVTWSDGRRAGEVPLPYVWNGCPCQIPPAPEWMLSWALSATATGHDGGAGNGDSSGGSLADLATFYATGLPVGMRNVALMQLACQQFRRYGSADPDGSARLEIGKVLANTIRDGFPATERERTITSARDFIAACEREEQALADWTYRYVPDWWNHPGVKWPQEWHR
jgi:Bifunctional DNA primase/polymerase, N-terminal